MPSGKKRKRHKMSTHKRKKRLRKNRHKKKKQPFVSYHEIFNGFANVFEPNDLTRSLGFICLPTGYIRSHKNTYQVQKGAKPVL